MPKDEPRDEPDDTGGEGDDDDTGGGSNEERLERVEKAVEKLSSLVTDALGGDPADDDTGGGGEPHAAPRTIAAIEDATESRVRAAVAQLEREKETSTRLGAIEKAIEKVPRKVRRVTSLVWGPGDE